MENQKMTYEQYKEAVYKELFTYKWAKDCPEDVKRAVDENEDLIKEDYEKNTSIGWSAYCIALLV